MTYSRAKRAFDFAIAVWLRHEEDLLAQQADPIEFYKYTLLPRKIESDMQYVNGMSFREDVRLLAATVLCCLSLTPKVKEAPVEEAAVTSQSEAVEAA